MMRKALESTALLLSFIGNIRISFLPTTPLLSMAPNILLLIHAKNTSVTSLLYQEKGDTEDLKNYRPISVINADLNILTKALTNRLRQVLPLLIHFTPTAVDGRKIDNTRHMLRDLIQLSNNENLDSAFIFLDQEKAFDRVNHDFLYKTMHAFGIGATLIS